jgi:hypothetical protein
MILVIKIDLEKKLNLSGKNFNTSTQKFCDEILNYKHEIVTLTKDTVKNKKTKKKKKKKKKNKKIIKRNRFDLSINKDTEYSAKTKMKIEDILYHQYINDINVKKYIDEIFYSLDSSQKCRKLLEEILLCSPEDMEIRVKKIDNYKGIQPKEKIKKIFDYEREKKSSTDRIGQIFRDANFKVCVYCNRNYISNFETNNRKRITFTLDHFHQKNKYPILALSLYNLVPSCAVCNTNIKNTRNVKQYMNPHSSNYRFNEEAKFTFLVNNNVFIQTSNSDCQDYINDFYINDVYQTHKLEVEEIINKRKIFTDDMIRKLSKFSNRHETELKSFLFGEVIYTNNIANESLGKLKVDIASQLNIIDDIKI